MKQEATMKAIYLQGPMKISLKELPIPKPQDGQVLVKVMAAPINPSDYYFLRDANYDHKKAPCIPGFEGSGIVVENGGGFMGWNLVNKKVAFTPVQRSGTYSQYAIAKSSQCLPVDDSMSFQHASMSFVNPLTAMAMLDYAKQHKTKAVIMDAAASQLGRMANRLLPPEGINIINVVRKEEQVQVLRKEGANYIVNSSEPDFQQKLKEMITKMNAKVFYDAIGGEMTSKIMNHMPKNSITYVYGALDGGHVKNVNIIDLIYKNMTIKGLFLPTWLEQKGTIKLLPTFMKLRKLLLNELRSNIAFQFGLQQFEQNVKLYLKDMTKGKAVLKPFSQSKPKQQEKTQEKADQKEQPKLQEKSEQKEPQIKPNTNNDCPQ